MNDTGLIGLRGSRSWFRSLLKFNYFNSQVSRIDFLDMALIEFFYNDIIRPWRFSHKKKRYCLILNNVFNSIY